ncbi:MAG: helix-turn-helix domain-containing protein [Micavibrio sp.]|nr:helix-turn-helix domain-containing protein [Micavibrio sp.]
MTTVPQRLAYAIEYLDVSENDLAKKSGVPRTTLRGMLGGKSKTQFDTITQVANALGLSLNWLAYGVGEMLINTEHEDNILSEVNLKSVLLRAYDVKTIIDLRIEDEKLRESILKDCVITGRKKVDG